MKTLEIAKKYKIDNGQFIKYIRDNKLPYSETRFDIHVDDELVEAYVTDFKNRDHASAKQLNERLNQVKAEENQILAQLAAERARMEEEENEHNKELSKILITSGFSFEGYRIVKYSGYISGDDAISVNRDYAFFEDASVKDKLMNSLVVIRRNALRELKEAAYNLGCNAVIGVDFDYLTLDPQTASITGGTVYQPYVFGVTANGNAVVIEKIENE